MENDLKGLLIDELQDLLSAEEQIVKALPAMVRGAEFPELKKVFASHLNETRGQVQRLKKIFQFLKVKKKEKFCKGMNGLIQECKAVPKHFTTKSPMRDAALIAKAQRIEHYEISAYGTVCTIANELGLHQVINLLQATLNEEVHANQKLTSIAERRLSKIISPAPMIQWSRSKGLNRKNVRHSTKSIAVTSKRTSVQKKNLELKRYLEKLKKAA